MVDENKAAAWLQWDFVERTLELKPPVSAWVAKGLSKITVLFLRWLGCIPVFQDDYDKLADTLHLSMEVLRQGKCLLVFPEDNRLVADPVTGMRPFSTALPAWAKNISLRPGSDWYSIRWQSTHPVI
jgi:1-acyl-sn-glycerol-3-phosphate acyltransferase